MFKEEWIKFGILHFIATCSLLTFNYVDNDNVLYSILITSIIFYLIITIKPNIFKPISSPISYILSLYNDKYKAIDHFTIIPWISIFIIGILISKKYYKKDKKEKESNKIIKSFSHIGRYSLEIYLIHWIILFIYFKYIYT